MAKNQKKSDPKEIWDEPAQNKSTIFQNKNDNENDNEKINAKIMADKPMTWGRKLQLFIYGIMVATVGACSFYGAYTLSDGMESTERFLASVLTAILAMLVSIWIVSPIMEYAIKQGTKLANYLLKMPIQDILGGVIGLILGLIIASLLNTVIESIPIIGPYLAIISFAFCGYIGIIITYKKRQEIMTLWLSRSQNQKDAICEPCEEEIVHPLEMASRPKILDTSVIIDGRIADICRTGFVEGKLIIANFVLDELRRVADSQDVLKRNRGRRGLDVLNRLRKDMPDRIIVTDIDYPEIIEVDSKLLRLTQEMEGMVLTNDFNLNKVAQVQDVMVLNINELVNALKPVVLPGEKMKVEVVQDGKEANQGVGYLDDGTMIVVENGREFLGQTITVEVSSVLQTAAGRMIFVRASK